MTPETTAVRVQRTISAPPERVYRAWLDPDVAKRWFSPSTYTASNVEIDERIGGRYRVFHEGPEGDMGGMEGELLELVPNRRLDFRWWFVGPDRVADPALETRLTIALEPGPDGTTELTLVHERVEAVEAAYPGISEAAPVGWGQALDKLEAAVARPAG
jgi:uncharacterized protein YndB with AHSA1/START domain